MYLDKWDLIIIAGVLFFIFYRIANALDRLENRVSDLEEKLDPELDDLDNLLDD